MCGQRLPRPDWTHFFSRVIANRENKIHLRRSSFCEFVPVLAAQAVDGHLRQLKLFKRLWPYNSRGVASRTIGREAGLALMVQNGFGHDGSSRISGAKKKHVGANLHT